MNNHYNDVVESKYKINNSNEYLFMQLSLYANHEELNWPITKITDSTLLITRKVKRWSQEFDSKPIYKKVKIY